MNSLKYIIHIRNGSYFLFAWNYSELRLLLRYFKINVISILKIFERITRKNPLHTIEKLKKN